MCLAGKRRSDITGLTQPILSLGCRPRRIGVNLDKNAAALAGRIGDAREGFFDQRAARRAAGAKIRRKARQSRSCDRAHPGIFGKRCLSPRRLTQG